MAVALPAAAQEEAEVMEEVIVTGYRKSLIDSIENKRYNKPVIESISAEDIGKLPDSSIAESIARLPGLAAQRLDGRASRISIRGFGENERQRHLTVASRFLSQITAVSSSISTLLKSWPK